MIQFESYVKGMDVADKGLQRSIGALTGAGGRHAGETPSSTLPATDVLELLEALRDLAGDVAGRSPAGSPLPGSPWAGKSWDVGMLLRPPSPGADGLFKCLEGVNAAQRVVADAVLIGADRAGSPSVYLSAMPLEETAIAERWNELLGGKFLPSMGCLVLWGAGDMTNGALSHADVSDAGRYGGWTRFEDGPGSRASSPGRDRLTRDAWAERIASRMDAAPEAAPSAPAPPSSPEEHVAALRRTWAKRELLSIEEAEQALAANKAGVSQRDIAEVLGWSQTHVHRLIRKAKAGLPSETWRVILRATAGEISRGTMIGMLRTGITRGEYEPGEQSDGFAPGTLDEFRTAFLEDLLSEQEYEELRAQAPASSASGSPTAGQP